MIRQSRLADEVGVTASRYQSIEFDEVVVTLRDGTRLTLVPPFASEIRHDFGRLVVTIRQGWDVQSYWLSDVASVEYATYSPERALIVALWALLGGADSTVLTRPFIDPSQPAGLRIDVTPLSELPLSGSFAMAMCL
jgi:hypothetical protein